MKSYEKLFRFFFENFRKLFVRSVLLKIFPEIGGAETIRFVRKLSNFELSSRFFGRLKIFIGQGSLYSLEPIFQTPHYPNEKGRRRRRRRQQRRSTKFNRPRDDDGAKKTKKTVLKPCKALRKRSKTDRRRPDKNPKTIEKRLKTAQKQLKRDININMTLYNWVYV